MHGMIIIRLTLKMKKSIDSGNVQSETKTLEFWHTAIIKNSDNISKPLANM